jgi:hypothetical protein
VKPVLAVGRRSEQASHGGISDAVRPVLDVPGVPELEIRLSDPA